MVKIRLCVTVTWAATCVCCYKVPPQGKNTPWKESPVLLQWSIDQFTQGIKESWVLLVSRCSTLWMQLHILYSFEYKLLYMYVMSPFIQSAQRITPCCAVHLCSRNELTDGHELEQKSKSFLSRPARQLPAAMFWKITDKALNTYHWIKVISHA